MIKKFKENFIAISMWLLIVLILLNTALIFYNRSEMIRNNILQVQTTEVKRVWTEIFESDLRRMDMGLRGYALTRKQQLLDPYETGKTDIIKALGKIDSFLVVQELDSIRTQFETFVPKVHAYIVYAEEMKEFARRDSLQDFVRLLNEDRGYDLWQAFAPMFSFIQSYQDKLLQEAQSQYQQAMDRNVIFQVLLVLVTIPTLVAVMFRIRRDARNRRKLLSDFDKNNRHFLFDSGEAISAENAQGIIQSSIRNLKKASAFIKDIASGNYGAEWEGLNDSNRQLNRENLAGDMIKMRDQMKKVKELDEKRIWSTDGLAKFSDVARNNQNNIEKLSNEVIRFLTKHMKAQQGSLFILHDEEGEEPYLQLEACYAFDKKKFVEKKIDIGQGLIGQAYLEGSTVLLTALPKGYITITSGLGDSTPTCVIIVPMKYNERVEAVLELATFNKFEAHEVEFLEKAGEVIASSIYATKTNEKTAKLLKETQEQAEALRSQEEELRQNMEELTATQEDMRRREIEVVPKGKPATVR